MDFLNSKAALGRMGCLVAALAAAAAATPASAVTVAQWTFETSLPLTAGPFSPEVGSGSALGSHASASSVYSSPVGNGSAKSFSSNYWAVGDYYQFKVDTTGLSGVTLSWDQTSSGTGPRDFKLAYSTNGTNFTDFYSYSVLANAAPNPVWNGTTSSSLYTLTSNLTGVSALNNQATVYFRLIDNGTVSASGGTIGTAGTDRVDNFTVMAAAVPEPGTYALLLAGLAVIGSAARRRRA
jgi:hypothetical protein